MRKCQLLLSVILSTIWLSGIMLCVILLSTDILIAFKLSVIIKAKGLPITRCQQKLLLGPGLNHTKP